MAKKSTAKSKKPEVEILDKTSDEFGTPDSLFLPLDEEFIFTIDAAATAKNTKLPRWWDKEDDALKKSWANERVFCNPPYSRGNVESFFMKALSETRNGDCKLAVLIIPTFTERTWYHDYRNHFEVRMIKGRQKFIGGESGARGNHMILVFRSHRWAWWSA